MNPIILKNGRPCNRLPMKTTLAKIECNFSPAAALGGRWKRRWGVASALASVLILPKPEFKICHKVWVKINKMKKLLKFPPEKVHLHQTSGIPTQLWSAVQITVMTAGNGNFLAAHEFNVARRRRLWAGVGKRKNIAEYFRKRKSFNGQRISTVRMLATRRDLPFSLETINNFRIH